MQSLRSQSFDLFGRYSHVYRIRTESLPASRLRILDVGDPFGTISALFPDDETVSLDIYEDHAPTDGSHQHIVGSGFELPFADASFDLVCSHDVLEHLPGDRRTEFLAELLRVGAGPVVVVAPFGDPRSVRAEHLINSYFVARLGHTIDALDEHDQFVLPDTAAITGWLDESATPYARFGDGWLYHWVAFYYLKAHFIACYTQGELHRLDRACNDLLTGVDHTAPHYRTTLVLRPPTNLPDLPAPEQRPSDDEIRAQVDDLTEVAMSFGEALRPSENALREDTRLAEWITRRASSPNRAHQVLAASLQTALDKLRAETLDVGEPVRTVPVTPLRREVAVVLVNLNGVEHLPPCLDSLAAQEYPRAHTEVIVVDNGSTDGSLELLARDYPWVRVLPQGENTGFAAAVTTGVQSTTAECVVFINNDMRAHPSWLRELVKAYDPETGVVCVAAQIQSWDGERVDFVEGVMNFYGMGDQVGYGKALGDVDVHDGGPLLFACGGSMLVSRHVYLTSGGFDPAFFAYFEDVDFGWRLWVMGYEVRMAANAITYHRMHGTSSRYPDHQRTLLYERNGLRSIMKNYDDENLATVLAPALMLLARRAVSRGDLVDQRDAYAIGGDREPMEEVPRVTLAHLHAINDLIDDLDNLIEQRYTIQRARQRDDAEITQLFGTPFSPAIHDPEFLEGQQRIVEGFGLERAFDRRRARRVLCISAYEIGEKMRGPAIRAFEIAKALAPTAPTAVAVPGETDTTIDGIPVLGYDTEDALIRLAEACDIVIIHGYTLHNYPGLATLPAVMVVDLYDPFLFENVELLTDRAHADLALTRGAAVLNESLDAGDFFICASERQRDYWLGMLSARGVIESATYRHDPTLRQLIDVVPFGLPSHRPRHMRKVLKGVHPAVAEDNLVILWGGGVWDWFDPLSVIEAFVITLESVPNAKLYFLGLELPSPDLPPMRMAEAAVERSKHLGLYDTSIIFGDWATYEARESFLMEADVAISAAKDVAETRLAFRSRILDYLWAGLPVITTSGDVLSDLVRQHNLGAVVAPGNIAGLADAMTALLRDPARRADASSRSAQVADEFRWPNNVAPLKRVAREPWRWRLGRAARDRGRLVTQQTQMMLTKRDEEIALLKVDHDEVEFLRNHVEELEAIVRHKDRPYAMLRKVPGAGFLARVLRRARASRRG